MSENYHIFLFGKKPALTYQQVIFDMLSTPQTDTQNVLEHGISVNKYFNDLTNDMKWIGNYLVSNKQRIYIKNLHSKDIKEYQIMHDCGKPYCITIDEDGRTFS
jgi:hypothetical protein